MWGEGFPRTMCFNVLLLLLTMKMCSGVEGAYFRIKNADILFFIQHR